MTYRLPFPPSLNHMYPTVRGRRVLSSAGQRFKASVVALVLAQGRPAKPLAGRLRVEVHVYPPDRRRRDLSNLIKAVEDSLTAAGVWVDDEQVDHLTVVRREVVAGGKVEVHVESLGPAGIYT